MKPFEELSKTVENLLLQKHILKHVIKCNVLILAHQKNIKYFITYIYYINIYNVSICNKHNLTSATYYL